MLLLFRVLLGRSCRWGSVFVRRLGLLLLWLVWFLLRGGCRVRGAILSFFWFTLVTFGLVSAFVRLGEMRGVRCVVMR